MGLGGWGLRRKFSGSTGTLSPLLRRNQCPAWELNCSFWENYRRTCIHPAGRLDAKPSLHLILTMPDVGLTTASDPLPRNARVIIKYSVEVEGLPVYQESYDVAKLAEEIEKDRELVKELWFRRVECAVRSRHEKAFSATLTGCLAQGVTPG